MTSSADAGDESARPPGSADRAVAAAAQRAKVTAARNIPVFDDLPIPAATATLPEGPDLRETGYWRFVNDPHDPTESHAIELLLAHSAGYVELFYGRPLNQSSWELATDALARSRSGVLVGGANRLYGTAR